MRKNINPKTLKGQDKLNRMLDLMGRMNTLNESTSLSELELIKKGPNGITYGIIRENHDYFIKTSNKTSGTLMAEDFKYVGGLQNKYDERYKSYAEALKHLNIKFDMLNESYGIDNNTNLFESDGVAFGGGVGFGFVMEEDNEEEEKEIISDSDDDLEEQKKVIKVDAPKAETPAIPETPVEDEVEDEVEIDDSGDAADVDFGDEETDEEEVDVDLDTEEGDDNTKKIQKYTGKIGQMLRDMDEADLDLEKYVINSVISAMHLDEMDEEDKEDIIAKLEGEEEEGDEFDMEGSDEEVDMDLDAEEETTEETPEEGGEELSEDDDKMDKKEVVNITEKQMDMLHEKGICECGDKCLVYRESDVKDSVLLDKIAETKKDCVFISKEQMEELHDPKKRKCDCGDVTLKYKEGKKEKNEGRVFSKKQLMESFLRRETKKSLKKVLRERRELCQECGTRMVEGMCMECSMNEHHMGDKATYTDFPKYRTKDYQIMGEEDRVEEGNEFAYKLKLAREKGDKTFKVGGKTYDVKEAQRRGRGKRRMMDEEEMDVMDAIATGQGYLDATGDLDRDFDGIPNRLDMDNNDDGELDFVMGRKDRYRSIGDDNEDFIELDIDFLRNSSPGTKEKDAPTINPTTNPDEDNKWRKIRRPLKDPRPKAIKDKLKNKPPKPSFRRRGMF